MRCIIATTSFHVVDQMGVDTAAVSGNLYLQLVVENGVPFSPVLGPPFATPIVSASVFNDSQPLFQSFSASVVQLVEWVCAVCARLGGKVAVEGLTDVLPMKGKSAKNYPQVW